MERFGLVVVGLNFGHWLIEDEILGCYGSPYFRLVTVCDKDRELAGCYAEKYGVKAYYALEDALADEQIQLVALITGPNGRAELIDKILECGKAVMTTKPFETDAGEALRILQKAQKLNIPLYINSPAPFMPEDIACMQDWADEYRLGRIVGYHAFNWAAYREEADGSWYDDPAQCPAAPLLRLGIYCLGDLSWFMPADLPAVQVVQSRIFTQRPMADNAAVMLTHDDGTIGTVYSSFCVGDGHAYPQAMELQFENGSIRREITWTGNLENDRIHLQLRARREEKPVQETRVLTKYGNGYRWDLMHAALRGGPLPGRKTPPEQIVRCVRLVEEMKKACQG